MQIYQFRFQERVHRLTARRQIILHQLHLMKMRIRLKLASIPTHNQPPQLKQGQQVGPY